MGICVKTLAAPEEEKDYAMRLLQTALAIVCFGPAATAHGGDGGEAVKKAVLEPQEAGWGRHDFKTYMTQWADNAQIVVARGEKPDKHDIVFDRKQIEATRRLIMHGKAAPDQKMTFENVKVKVEGDEAVLRLRSTVGFGEDYQIADEIYRLRKTSAGWKVYLNRGWTVKAKWGKEVISYDTDKWKMLDETANDLVRTDERGERAAQALLLAWRFKEAHALCKKITDRKDAAASDWLQRGHAAMSAGFADDALAAFRQALKLDENAPAPSFARQKE